MNRAEELRNKGVTRTFGAWIVLSALTVSLPVLAQQKTGPGITSDDALTWHGITLYGVIDIGLQYDTHSAPFTPYRPAASGNIVRQNEMGPRPASRPAIWANRESGFRGMSTWRGIGRLCSRWKASLTPSPARSRIP